MTNEKNPKDEKKPDASSSGATPEEIAQKIQLTLSQTNVHIHSGELPMDLLPAMEMARPGTMAEVAKRVVDRIDLEHDLTRSDNFRKNVVVLGIFLFLFAILAVSVLALYLKYPWAGSAGILSGGAGLLKVLSATVFDKNIKDEKPKKANSRPSGKK